MLLRSAALAALLALSACQTASAPAPLVAVQPLDAQLVPLAERSHAPGIVAAIYRDGRVSEIYAWGGALCDGSGQANALADFEIGSISKHMTAVAVLQLWEQDRVDLNANVGAYLSDIPDAWKRVTLRQLLTHTSGVPDYEEAGGYGVYETSPTPSQVFDIVRDKPLDFEPGTQWSYSNTGYFLLSLVVQHVSGQRFGDYMREHVFAPNHLDHTFVSGYGPRDATITQGCKPGEHPGDARIPVRPISEASTFGAGGILSTLQDWALWDEALQQGHVLSPRAMHELFTPVTLPNGENTGYAMGMEVSDFRGEAWRGHSGQTQGFVALYTHFPERHVSIMLFANQYQASPDALLQALQLRAVPDLSYDRLPSVADPDAARTERTRRAIRQMLLAEQPLDLLAPRLQDFATSADYADQRARLHDVVANIAKLEFLREEPPPNGGYERYLFRATAAGGDTSYFMANWRDGKLIGLRWYDE